MQLEQTAVIAKQIKWWDLSKIGGHKLKLIRILILISGVNCIALNSHVPEYRLIFIVFGMALLSLYVFSGE